MRQLWDSMGAMLAAAMEDRDRALRLAVEARAIQVPCPRHGSCALIALGSKPLVP
jgi:hypothetical protein